MKKSCCSDRLMILCKAMIIKSYTKTMIFYLLLVCFCIINTFFSHAADTISANQTLSGDQTIVSSGGNFELGFFTSGNSSKHYIGIWYKRVEKKTIVWVANRETPISDKNSARLKILDSNLVLLNESQIKIWSTDVSSTAATSFVIAVLLDDGNLVLREGIPGTNSTSFGQTSLWDSLSNPTDTWMPGAKIGYDKRMRKEQIPTCWKNSADPAPGLYSIEYKNEGRLALMWNRSEQYWTTGSWNGHIFSLLPEMLNLDYLFNFSYVDNENESYFTYNPSVKSIIFISVSGQMSWLDNTNWNLFMPEPRQLCDVQAYCGAFSTCNPNSSPVCSCLPGYKIKSEDDWKLKDFSGGCVREIDFQCDRNGTVSKGRKDKFMNNLISSLPAHYRSLTVKSMDECESACLSNCSCTAYAYDDSGCSLWNGEILNLQQLYDGEEGGKTIYNRLSASSSVFYRTKSDKRVVISTIVGSVAIMLVLLAVISAVVCRHRVQKVGTSKAMEGFLVAFRYKDLENATKNFSDKVGVGGFGSVFKGTLPDSTVVAVKKLESISQGDKQFRMEVGTIGMVQHVNLVRLRGFCAQGNKKLLVYDYMENGSLASHLFNKDSKVLKWKTRYQIALGVARGLAYLHENCKDCIIHCDIKPENVLLNGELCAKVADFGLAKLVGRDFSRVLTTMRGTLGYLAPEWISGVAITSKADVYSYGMMLFELISGKRNWAHSEDEHHIKYFPCLAASVTIEGGDMLGLLDPVLDGDADIKEVSKMCRVACWCIQSDENIRPSMGQVVQIFDGVANVNVPPIPRWHQRLVESPENSYV